MKYTAGYMFRVFEYALLYTRPGFTDTCTSFAFLLSFSLMVKVIVKIIYIRMHMAVVSFCAQMLGRWRVSAPKLLEKHKLVRAFEILVQALLHIAASGRSASLPFHHIAQGQESLLQTYSRVCYPRRKISTHHRLYDGCTLTSSSSLFLRG